MTHFPESGAAAQIAMRRLACEEAARHLDRALDALSTIAECSGSKRAELLRLLGEARRPELQKLRYDGAGATGATAGRSSSRAHYQTALITRQGECWTLVFRGCEFRLKDSKGVRYLDTLLRHPHTAFHALILAADGVATTSVAPMALASDVGPILDQRVRREYAVRLDALRCELAEAERHTDLGQVERLRREIDLFCAQLESAVSPTGAVRRWTSPAERARLSVTKAIRATQKRIARACPGLGQHLANCVKTGLTCSYVPEPNREVEWRT